MARVLNDVSSNTDQSRVLITKHTNYRDTALNMGAVTSLPDFRPYRHGYARTRQVQLVLDSIRAHGGEPNAAQLKPYEGAESRVDTRSR